MTEVWRFFRDPGTTGPMDDPRLALLASCVANQQRFAGFGDCIDIREAKCPICRAPGFNTGMGFWKHTCGAEVSSDGEDCSGCEAEEPFPQPQTKPGGDPCGECHIQPGETCDVCGAVADSIPTIEEAQRRMAAAGPSPFLTTEAIEALGKAEEEAEGCLVRSTPRLSDCPFCGGLARFQQIEFDEWNENSGGQYIECSVCECCTHLMFACGDDVKPLLADIWNGRTCADGYAKQATATTQSSARCTRCGGAGSLQVDEPECNGGRCRESCDRCGGAGFVMDTDPFSSVDRPCKTCEGTGSI